MARGKRPEQVRPELGVAVGEDRRRLRRSDRLRERPEPGLVRVEARDSFDAEPARDLGGRDAGLVAGYERIDEQRRLALGVPRRS